VNRAGNHDTAVATAASATWLSDLISFGFSMVCGRGPLLAPAVLMVVVSAACFNPNHIGQAVPKENHVPVVEVFPAPSFAPLQADVALDAATSGCAPLSFNIVRLEDADGDPLTIRFDMVLNRGAEVRQNLKLSAPLQPLDDGSYPLTANTELTLDAAQLNVLGDLRAQAESEDHTQLVELRVSDSGFVPGNSNEPIAADDGGLFFFAWAIKLTPCTVVTP
jgi:hypothetical protein